jgi:hypothetical protein
MWKGTAAAQASSIESPRVAECTILVKTKWPGQCPAIVLEISAFDLRL